MPVIVSCPECGTKLRVPDTAVGKRVKCSKCATAFVAEPPAEDAGVQAAPPGRLAPPEEPVSARKPARRRDEEPDDEDDEEGDDDYDEERFRRRDDGGVSTLIPYRNGRALAAYYCGVFSFIPCIGLILGPIALVLGILGLRFARAHPSAKGTGHAIAGIVCGSITTLGNWGFFLLMVIGMIIGATSK
jgi:predicted Zn finger-like uncharacterized protein